MKKNENNHPPAKGGKTDPSGKKAKSPAEFPGGEENAAGKSNSDKTKDKYGSPPVKSEDINRGDKQ